MVQKNIRFAIILIIAYTLNACTNGVNENRLPGVYASNFEDYSDTIFLNSDHTYVYKQCYRKSYSFRKGVWTVKNGFITFKKFSFHQPQNSPIGNWNAEIKIVNNEVRIIYADEEGYYYRKIKN
jgi:hypothetical protein